jgi:hypothetical protein
MNMGGFGRMGTPLASGFWLLAGIASIWIGDLRQHCFFRTFWVMAERKVPPIDPR